MQQQNNEIIRNLEQQKTDMHKILSILSKTQKNQEDLGSDISVETN
jgi:hypothetical protein